MRLLKILSICALCILTLSLTSKIERKKMVTTTIKKINKVKVLSIFFPTDSGLWTDRIISAFTSSLQKTGLDIDFSSVSYTHPQTPDHTMEKIKKQEADIIFLPDDGLYKLFGQRLKRETKAHIVFVTFYSKKSDLPVNDERFSAIFCDAPIEHLLKRAQEITPIKSISVVGGPFAKDIIEMIKNKIRPDISLKITLAATWDEYLSAINSSKDFDSIWPITPFGVTLSDGKWVSFHQYESLLSSIEKFTLGYAKLAHDKHQPTMAMNIDPSDLGSNAAEVTFKHLRGEPSKIKLFTSYSLRISKKSLSKLNLKLPEKLLGFLVY